MMTAMRSNGHATCQRDNHDNKNDECDDQRHPVTDHGPYCPVTDDVDDACVVLIEQQVFRQQCTPNDERTGQHAPVATSLLTIAILPR
ncbi:hypothetical protein [Bifidobacterium tissieri]|uniref:hypothetical protein n=1 Tax=Bifidobacterium tissieri TaxID=1630162 RepID=UPI00168A9443|nr:hypothetical protein [Bifidobacterium tissieri]